MSNIIRATVSYKGQVPSTTLPEGHYCNIVVEKTGLFIGQCNMPFSLLDIDEASVREAGSECVIKIGRDYSSGHTKLMAKHGKYKAYEIEGSYFIPLENGVEYINTNIVQFPISVVDCNDESDSEDAWSYISRETGVDRPVVKRFFYGFWDSTLQIPYIAKELKLSTYQVKHLITAFDTWTGSEG